MPSAAIVRYSCKGSFTQPHVIVSYFFRALSLKNMGQDPSKDEIKKGGPGCADGQGGDLVVKGSNPL